ncbi:MAG: hypothetical protein FWH29_10800 [Methanobrevibacter sp.]|nr:hypothetical protein [Methanobrevibacter sp.]
MNNLKECYNYLKVANDFHNMIHHKKAVKIANGGFFLSCVDALAPFGSDEGDLTFEEFYDCELIILKNQLLIVLYGFLK